MSKEMNRIQKNGIKYDIFGGVIFSLMVFLITDLKCALVFLLGLAISLINFIISGRIIERLLIEKKSKFFTLTYILKIITVLVFAMPFIWELKTILAYMLGYISHFIFLMIYWIRNERGVE